MAQLSILVLMVLASLAAALRWAQVLRQRRLRKASRARRAAREKRWEETTGQVMTDDWRKQ